MSDNPLADVADRFTTDLVNLYGAKAGTSIAYLPGGIPVPDYFVQNGTVNVTQVSEWLHGTFDAPLLVDGPGDVAVSILPPGYGSAMYERAVLGAQPIGPIDSDVRSQVNDIIASARTDFGLPFAAKIIGCLPLDWPVETIDDYWASFDSSAEITTTTTTAGVDTTPPPPRRSVSVRINPTLWQLREYKSVVVEPPDPGERPPILLRPDREGPIRFRDMRLQQMTVEAGPAVLPRAAMANRVVSFAAPAAFVSARMEAPARVRDHRTEPEVPAMVRDHRTGVFSDDSTPERFQHVAVFGPGRVVQDVTTTATSSSLVVTLRHTCVALSRSFGGVTWWDDIFLRDHRWYLPGEPSGALLPPALPPTSGSSTDADGSGDAVTAATPVRTYAIPVGLVLVRDLAVKGSWSSDATQVLSSSSGLLGPFNLTGAKTSQAADGTTTYARSGLQVVAVLYSSLPVVPPAPDPYLAPSSVTTPADGTTTDSTVTEVTDSTTPTDSPATDDTATAQQRPADNTTPVDVGAAIT